MLALCARAEEFNSERVTMVWNPWHAASAFCWCKCCLLISAFPLLVAHFIAVMAWLLGVAVQCCVHLCAGCLGEQNQPLDCDSVNTEWDFNSRNLSLLPLFRGGGVFLRSDLDVIPSLAGLQAGEMVFLELSWKEKTVLSLSLSEKCPVRPRREGALPPSPTRTIWLFFCVLTWRSFNRSKKELNKGKGLKCDLSLGSTVQILQRKGSQIHRYHPLISAFFSKHLTFLQSTVLCTTRNKYCVILET